MSIKNKFFDHLQAHGLCPDAAEALDREGLLKEGICEKYLIKERYKILKGRGKTLSWIFSELASEFCKSEDRIRHIVYDK